MKTFLVYLLLLVLAHLAVLCWVFAPPEIAAAATLLTVIAAMIAHWRMLFQPTQRLSSNLSRILSRRNYSELPTSTILTRSFSRWLTGSMLDSDITFQVAQVLLVLGFVAGFLVWLMWVLAGPPFLPLPIE